MSKERAVCIMTITLTMLSPMWPSARAMRNGKRTSLGSDASSAEKLWRITAPERDTATRTITHLAALPTGRAHSSDTGRKTLREYPYRQRAPRSAIGDELLNFRVSHTSSGTMVIYVYTVDALRETVKHLSTSGEIE